MGWRAGDALPIVSKRASAPYPQAHVQAPEEVGHHLLIQLVRDVAQERLQQQPAKNGDSEG